MGKVPIISVNKTDGCHIYLSKDSLDCEIVSAKSSEMNVLIVKEDGDYVSVSVSHNVCTLLIIADLTTICPYVQPQSLRLVFQTEFAVPEQFKTVWDGTKLVTTATEIAG